MSDGSDNDLVELRRSMREKEGPVIDVAAWVGAYPFRGIPNATEEDLRAKMRELNIVRAIASPYEGIFWENGLEAYERFAERYAGEGAVEIWPVVRPGGLHGLERLLDRYSPRGLRLTPNYHGYPLSDAAVAPIMAMARERGLVVQVFQRIADERWHYLLKVPAVEQFDLDYLTACYPEQRIVLSGMNSLAPVASRLRQLAGLYADVSRIRGPQFVAEGMVKSLPVEKLVFGSLWPQQIMEATLWQFTTGEMGEEARRAILHDNAARLLGRGGAAR